MGIILFYNPSGGTVETDLVLVYTITAAGANTLITSDLNLSYNIVARIEGDLTIVYDINQLGVELPEDVPPVEIIPRLPQELDLFAQRLYDYLGPAHPDDEEHGWPLNYYIGGLGSMFEEILDYAGDTDVGPGWSILLDINRIPTKGLAWLAQFVGVNLDYDATDKELRQQVRAHDSWGRGTPLSILSPAEKWVPGTSKILMSERNPTPYHVTFIFLDNPVPTQTYQSILDEYDSYHHLRIAYSTYGQMLSDTQGDWDKVEAELKKNKPGGIVYSFIFANNIIYMAIFILYPSYQEVYDAYPTYDALLHAPFPDINVDIPKYRRLVSARYYRNIYNQYETYADVLETYKRY